MLGDRIAVLRDGRVEQLGTPDEIWRTPATTFVARFVGLTDPIDAQAAIILMSLFTVGEMFVLFLAVRQALPVEVYELAAIEDATQWDVVRRITLPLMAPAVGLLLLRDLILSLQVTFVPALVVTQGGPPPYATLYLPLYIYRTGFEYLRYGVAAAATLVILVLTVPVVVLQWRLIRRLRHLYGL